MKSALTSLSLLSPSVGEPLWAPWSIFSADITYSGSNATAQVPYLVTRYL